MKQRDPKKASNINHTLRLETISECTVVKIQKFCKGNDLEYEEGSGRDS